jgi:lipopolysaccharide/colanic/teichoic acid biosynthesis glycosyltransferase
MQNISDNSSGTPGEIGFDQLKEDQSVQFPQMYPFFKQLFDRLIALMVLPVIMGVGIILLVLNPFLNRGPLLYIQKRTGMNGAPFRMVKFRSMKPASDEARDPTAAVETDRITPLGRYLRQSRIDELPNFWNVLMGHMSIVGPRPDAVNHAEYFAKTIPGYSNRHAVRPGITGLAQVSMGYAEGEEDTIKKIVHDQSYIQKLSLWTDMNIMVRTVGVMATGFGSK